MSKPRVSVLIPVYNCEAYIGEAIESVLAQTYTDWELIVVDDGSADGSARAAEAYPAAKVFRRPHAGIPVTRNFAIERAGGELIAFLDADDLWKPDKLERQVGYLEEHPACDLVFCRYRNFTDVPDDRLTSRQKGLLRVEISDALVGACIRKRLFDEFGLFNTGYPYGEDTELVLRWKIAGIDMAHRLDDCLFFRRIHGENITLTHGDIGSDAYYKMASRLIRERWNRERSLD